MADRIYRTKADYDELARQREQLAEAAAFLDQLAADNERHGYSTEAADCRKMAAKLRASSPLD